MTDTTTNVLPSSKHHIIRCGVCDQETVIETKKNHYCSEECAHRSLVEYWRNKWPQRKLDPIAKAHVEKAKKKYALKKKK